MDVIRWSVILMYVFLFLNCQTQEFLYPVDKVIQNKKEKILVLYQNNNHLELWLWDPETLEATKGLLSSFSPAGIRSLPNKEAFSFIDHDRVRVKELVKRSPKAIDLSYGPYDFSTIEWIDNNSFYFSARERNNFSIFHGTLDGELYKLLHASNIDFIYPQKIKNFIFYIARYEDGSCTIEQTEYPVTTISQNEYPNKSFEEKYKEFNAKEYEYEKEPSIIEKYINLQTKKILYKNNKSKSELAFLRMINEREGYFLTHPTFIEYGDSYMVFECHKLTCIENNWSSKILFNFSIPLNLLLSQYSKGEQLYESIFPLLPLYCKNTIYYVHDEGNGLDIYRYTEQKESSEKLIYSFEEHHFFPPFIYKEKYYYGGTVCHGDGLAHYFPQMWINEYGEQRFIFPELTL